MTKKVTLGSLMHRRKEKFGTSNLELKVYSVTNTKGLIPSDDLHDNSIYSEDVSNYLKVYPNDFVYNPARLNIGSFARMKSNECGIVSPMYIVFSVDEKVIDYEYFERLIFKKDVFNRIISSVEHGARFRFDYSNWNKITVNIPSIEIQRNIVKKLRTFKKLEVELIKELEMRKQQYEFWRGILLNKENNIVKISEITNSVSSGRCSLRNESGEYPVYGSTGIIARTDNYAYENEKLLIARVGANAGYVHIATGKYDVTDNTLVLDLKENVNMRYIYYYLQNYNLNKIAKGGGQPLITGGQIKNLEINLPSLEEQARIVNILDKFDKLVNDISEGLPAEIESRRKQYEYYRDKLLSFEEVEVNE